MNVLETLQNQKKHYAITGQCNHNPEFFTTSDIPGTDVHITNCGVCGEEIERWYK